MTSVFGRQVTILDDRGSIVPLFDERGSDRRDLGERAAIKAASAGYDHSLMRSLSGEEVAITLMIAFVPLGLMLVVSRIVGKVPWYAWGAFYVGSVAIGGLASNARRRAQARRIRASILERGMCASCGYSLTGAPTAPDGCAVCPECGAAWKRPQ